ncbi:MULTISPECIES: PleD family two-component system response regulator [Trichocoleus]|uniref:Response regulator n=1 Tax=Trichocoleus desertorum GB2-A4 TaxID=2933944 RepID=A0ABV0JCP9_9CYAN|nr:response regulator [Trichocoleus sp. FACHB-46]MBD1864214.1 response regulator [Trichocoleus sp. FACHB-46]
MTDAPISEPSPAIRVLVVEDDDSNRLLMDDYLTHQGYQVLSLAEGSSFFSTLAQFQPHVVLLDLKLPNISGYQLLEGLRQNIEFQHLPVIVLTASAFRTERQQVLQLGVQGYFVKPSHPKELIAAIEKVCAG